MEPRCSYLSHLECGRCETSFDATRLNGTCTQCGAPLLARYDLAALAAQSSREVFAHRAPRLCRYHELLPATAAERVITLGEGMTPLLPAPNLGRALGIERLLIKDEG